MDKIVTYVYRLFMTLGFALMIIAVVDWIMRFCGYTLSFLPYQPGRLFEISAIMMIVAICILLRQIRDKIK